jgi:hypothetical protein
MSDKEMQRLGYMLTESPSALKGIPIDLVRVPATKPEDQIFAYRVYEKYLQENSDLDREAFLMWLQGRADAHMLATGIPTEVQRYWED